MAHKEEEEKQVTNFDFTFDELQDAFDELLTEFKKSGLKKSLIKKMIASLTKENKDLQNTNEVLKKENFVFNEKIKDLENSLSNMLKK